MPRDHENPVIPRHSKRNPMKPKTELQAIIEQIASADSPVGMDAVYVHSLILDKLESIENRLEALEDAVEDSANE